MWEIVVGGETTPPEKAEAFWKWKIKTGNAMFAITLLKNGSKAAFLKRGLKT